MTRRRFCTARDPESGAECELPLPDERGTPRHQGLHRAEVGDPGETGVARIVAW